MLEILQICVLYLRSSLFQFLWKLQRNQLCPRVLLCTQPLTLTPLPHSNMHQKASGEKFLGLSPKSHVKMESWVCIFKKKNTCYIVTLIPNEMHQIWKYWEVLCSEGGASLCRGGEAAPVSCSRAELGTFSQVTSFHPLRQVLSLAVHCLALLEDRRNKKRLFRY